MISDHPFRRIKRGRVWWCAFATETGLLKNWLTIPIMTFSLHGEQRCKIKNDVLVTVCVCKEDITVECYRQKTDQRKSRDCMLISFILAGKQVLPNEVYLAS